MSATLAVAELFALCRQQAHTLRHTFASHFIQNGGKILGHSSLAMTMRYAHLAPEHPAEAIN